MFGGLAHHDLSRGHQTIGDLLPREDLLVTPAVRVFAHAKSPDQVLFVGFKGDGSEHGAIIKIRTTHDWFRPPVSMIRFDPRVEPGDSFTE